MEVNLATLQCPHCHRVYAPRVRAPRKCPFCQKVLNDVAPQQPTEKATEAKECTTG